MLHAVSYNINNASLGDTECREFKVESLQVIMNRRHHEMSLLAKDKTENDNDHIA